MKECNIPKIILVQGFCPLKIKVAQCPYGFRLKSVCSVMVNKPYICMQQLSQLRNENTANKKSGSCKTSVNL